MIKRFRELTASEFVRNVFTLMSATTIAQGISILIYFILARIYSTSEHGIFGLYMSIIAITGIISTGKYESAIMLPREEDKAINLLGLSSVICFIFSILLLILISLFHNVFAIWLGDPGIERWLWFVPLSTLLIGLFQGLSYWYNRNKRFRGMAIANVGQSLSNSAIKASTSRVFLNGGGLITGAIIGQFIGITIFIIDFIKKDLEKLKWIKLSRMRDSAINYNLFPRFNMVHHLVNNFSANLPLFFIASKFGASQAGLYSFAFLMTYRPVYLVTYSFTQVFSQRIIGKYNLDQSISLDVKRLTIRLFQAGLIPFLIAAIWGPVLFSLFFGDRWSESGRYMQILLPWHFMVLISSPLSFLPEMLKRQQKAMWLDIIKFVLRILSLLIGVYYNNIYLALILFSLVSTLSVGYSLYWYHKLAAGTDKLRQAYAEERVELPEVEL